MSEQSTSDTTHKRKSFEGSEFQLRFYAIEDKDKEIREALKAIKKLTDELQLKPEKREKNFLSCKTYFSV